MEIASIKMELSSEAQLQCSIFIHKDAHAVLEMKVENVKCAVA